MHSGTCDLPSGHTGFTHRHTWSVEEHARCFSGWQSDYNQVTSGLFQGSVSEICLEGLQLIRDRSNQAMVKSGEVRADSVIFSLPLELNPHELYCEGHLVNEPRLLAAPGHNLPDVRTSTGLDLLTVVVETRVLRDILERQKGEIKLNLEQAAGCFPLIHPSCRDELVTLIDSLEKDQSSANPALLSHAAIRTGIRDTVLMCLLDLMDHEEATSLAPHARKRIVDRACEYALANKDAPPSIVDLCNQVGTSRRKMQYCFQESLGINPVAYLRMLRLNAVHRDLLGAGFGAAVQDIAMSWGFWHLSRFAAEYRQLFGESPSETLRRTHQHLAESG